MRELSKIHYPANNERKKSVLQRKAKLAGVSPLCRVAVLVPLALLHQLV